MADTAFNGETNIYPQLDNGMQSKLNEINRTKYYFMAEICKKETMS